MSRRFDRAGMRRSTNVLYVVLLALAWASADAVTVHTWVDEAGVRHFADAPPDAGGPSSEAIELADTGIANDAGDDYYSVVNQWQRMRDERAASDALALERDRVRNEERALAAAREAPPQSQTHRYGGYYGGFPLLPHAIGRHGGHHGAHGGHSGKRRASVVHATPPEWPRHRYFRR